MSYLAKEKKQEKKRENRKRKRSKKRKNKEKTKRNKKRKETQTEFNARVKPQIAATRRNLPQKAQSPRWLQNE